MLTNSIDTAYAKNPTDSKWYDYDDSRSSALSSSEVCTKAAYLLFYRRVSSIPADDALSLPPSQMQSPVQEALPSPNENMLSPRSIDLPDLLNPDPLPELDSGLEIPDGLGSTIHSAGPLPNITDTITEPPGYVTYEEVEVESMYSMTENGMPPSPKSDRELSVQQVRLESDSRPSSSYDDLRDNSDNGDLDSNGYVILPTNPLREMEDWRSAAPNMQQ